ncbi:hypothetical protein ACFOY8_14535 [Thalassospira xianhensis]|uniref:Uncharacterized protein n=1 Tax=Thalassospira xianhensis MCCC 1A02616 TaxID=1177929 RepID=A0A367UHZ0_9PROT|nr:hypothetical protein [Thalassospira xianhensis]RCK07630.1 hypothetical protein TH5_00710 [Thalassospira xianhensis MCCC 1A02616]
MPIDVDEFSERLARADRCFASVTPYYQAPSGKEDQENTGDIERAAAPEQRFRQIHAGIRWTTIAIVWYVIAFYVVRWTVTLSDVSLLFAMGVAAIATCLVAPFAFDIWGYGRRHSDTR